MAHWLNVQQYLDKINSDSKKYFDFEHSQIVEIQPQHLPLNPATLFANPDQPLKFEIGFGNGDSLIALAAKHPEINYFGIDRKMERARTTLNKIKRTSSLPNLIISRIGTDYLQEMFPDGTFDEIIMNFPDPWPKKKHHKNRTVNNDFLQELHRLLKPAGIYRFASDHAEYSVEIAELFKNSPLFKNLYAPQPFLHQMQNRIQTQFERHKTAEGFTIHYMKFQKI